MDLKEFENIVSKKGDYGLCPPPVSHQEGMNILIEYFLGNDWYVTMPISPEQVNTEAIYNIMCEYRSKHRTTANVRFRWLKAIFTQIAKATSYIRKR